ncbi:hypothetical protein YQE_10944, partial [Dendroctonus ponderosae]
MPEGAFVLPPRDDAAEYDESSDVHNVEHDPKHVVWRKSNKAFIKLLVVPNANLQANQDVVCGFSMEHIYTNILVATMENKQPQKSHHRVRIFFNLGKIT